MGNSSSYVIRPASSKKEGVLIGHDVPAALDEEERRPHYSKGRASSGAACHAMERQNRHSRFVRRSTH